MFDNVLNKPSMPHKLKIKPKRLAPYQVRLEYITCEDGFKMPVTIVGTGEPVLLLHAFGMDARQFLPFILPLVKDFCFYLPHFRGFGLSADLPTTQFDFIEQYANDVDGLLTHICHQHKKEAIDVAAISMGALVMWAYFNRHLKAKKSSINNKTNNEQNPKHPNLNVKRYLNIDQSPTVHNLPDWQGGVFGDKQSEIFSQFQSVLDLVLPYLDSNDTISFVHLPYIVKREITNMERAFSLLSVGKKSSRFLIQTSQYQLPRKLALYDHRTWRQKIRCLQAYLALPYDYRENIHYLTIPVTMLIAGQSALYDPKWQYQIANILPNVNPIEIKDAGHAIPMDSPFAFSKVLSNFLKA